MHLKVVGGGGWAPLDPHRFFALIVERSLVLGLSIEVDKSPYWFQFGRCAVHEDCAMPCKYKPHYIAPSLGCKNVDAEAWLVERLEQVFNPLDSYMLALDLQDWAVKFGEDYESAHRDVPYKLGVRVQVSNALAERHSGVFKRGGA